MRSRMTITWTTPVESHRRTCFRISRDCSSKTVIDEGAKYTTLAYTLGTRDLKGTKDFERLKRNFNYPNAQVVLKQLEDHLKFEYFRKNAILFLVDPADS